MSTAVSAPAKGLVMKASGELEMRQFSTLKEKQAAVGGYIETVYHPSNGEFVGLCNEDGLSEGLEINKRASFLFRQPVFGDVVVFGDEPGCEDFLDVPFGVLLVVLSVPELRACAEGSVPGLAQMLLSAADNSDIIDTLWCDGWHDSLFALVFAADRLAEVAR